MKANPPVRWFQFSLRTLALGVLIFSIGMGWYVSRARQQEALYRAFYRSNSSAHYDYQIVDGEYDPTQQSWAPAWLHQSLGSDFLHSVVKVRLWDDVRGSSLDLHQLDLRQVDEFCERLDGFPGLRSVRLEYTTDERLMSLGRLRHLRRLELDGGQHLTDRGLAGLGQLSNLRQLDVRRVELPPTAWEHVGKLNRLEVLYAGGEHFTDETLADVMALQRLRELRVGGHSRLTDDGLRQLAQLLDLEVLEVSGTSISDEGFAHLARLSRLRHLTLRLRDSHVTNEGIAHLASLAHLEELTLMDIDATEDDIMPLANLPRLAKLRVTGKNLQNADALIQAMPNCSIALR